MAFDDKDAYWLGHSDQILNTYFGDIMFRCAEVIKKIIWIDDCKVVSKETQQPLNNSI